MSMSGKPYGDDPARRMPEPGRVPEPPEPRGPRVSAGRLWAGGVVAAAVAALAAVVAMLLIRGVLDVQILESHGHGMYANADTGTIALGAAVAALVATLLLHLLLLAAPQPLKFFGWIVALATIAMVLVPFTTGASLSTRIATACLHAFLGLVVGSLLTAVGRGAYERGPYAAG